MSNVGVHDFSIPHEFVLPTRDIVIVRLPLPPKTIGKTNLIIPQIARDMAQHNVMAGRVVAMGPMAFAYKDGEGLSRQDVKIGDWVTFRPFAGTMVQGGTLVATNGVRYLSSFQDVIGIIPADKMPDPATLLWNETDEPELKPVIKEVDNTRERIKIEKA